MSSKYYPYLSDVKKLKIITCSKCGENGAGKQLTWQVSWFRGEDEIENLCNKHAEQAIAENKKNQDAYEDRKENSKLKQSIFIESLREKLEEKYSVKILTPYQWRINGVVDVYPVNRNFHDIKNNKRGSYQDVNKFLYRFFSKT